jgi:ribosomal-protein-alanine N-acetyltransferase
MFCILRIQSIKMNFNPFPILSTERLSLRQLNRQDENEIFVLRSDERVLEYIDIPKAESIEDARNFIDKINSNISKNESIMWGITLANSNTLIGTICFWNIAKKDLIAEIGYMLHPDLQGKGIMQEAVSEVIKYGFQTMKLTSIVADLHCNNTKSLNLLEKNGFMYTQKSNEGGYVIYTLTRQIFGN